MTLHQTFPDITAENTRAVPRRPSGAWHRTAAARAILAVCAGNPPKGYWVRTPFALTTDERFEYAGSQADTLRAIRAGVGDAVLAYGDRTGDYGPMQAWCRSPSVDAAIEAAVAEVAA